MPTLRPSLLSPAERSFLGVLEPILPEGVGYIAKIRLGDVFVTKKGLDASRRTRAWNKINQKHVDFLIVRTSDFKPLAGVELDDRSHDEIPRRVSGEARQRRPSCRRQPLRGARPPSPVTLPPFRAVPAPVPLLQRQTLPFHGRAAPHPLPCLFLLVVAITPTSCVQVRHVVDAQRPTAWQREIERITSFRAPGGRAGDAGQAVDSRGAINPTPLAFGFFPARPVGDRCVD